VRVCACECECECMCQWWGLCGAHQPPSQVIRRTGALTQHHVAQRIQPRHLQLVVRPPLLCAQLRAARRLVSRRTQFHPATCLSATFTIACQLSHDSLSLLCARFEIRRNGVRLIS
jgi:hypothetical protein